MALHAMTAPESRNCVRTPVFTFKCVDCGTKNETTTPPSDNMMDCKKCGFCTVQVLDKVKR